MATIEVSGLTELAEAFLRTSNVPKDVKEDILRTGAKVMADAIEKEGRSMGVWDPEWDGKHVLESIKIKDPVVKDNKGYCDITFEGTRRRGNKTTRNAEIAFINEYGANRRGISARPFIWNGTAKAEDKAYDAAEEKFHKWLNNTF